MARFHRLIGFAIACLITSVLVLVPANQANAQTVIATDCSLDFKNVYFDNEPVCALVQAGGNVLGPPGFVCVVPPGGQPADDVTTGGCNAVGIFLEEVYLWFPPTTPGNYTILLVNNQGGTATDNIVIQSSGGAPPTIDPGPIKAAAAINAQQWGTLAEFGAHIADAASAISIAWAASSGDWLSAAVGVAGVITGIPTDYNDGVLQIGGQIIAALAGVQGARYTSLAADPPDPLFEELIALDLAAINADLNAVAPLYPGIQLVYPFRSQTTDPLHQSGIALANSMADEAALVFALMRTIEKVQGAEDANNDQFTLVQATQLKMYADQLASRLNNTRQLALDHKLQLQTAGVADVNYSGAEIAALIARLQTTGLDLSEEQSLRNAGFQDADIQLIFDRINAFPAPVGNYQPGAGLDAIVAAIDQMLPAVQGIGSQAQDMIGHYTPLVVVQHPTANPGGPYAGNQGSPILFDASGSTDPQGQLLIYAWDLDLDGAFDDAIGSAVSHAYDAPGSLKIGLRVTDTNGNSDIAYADVDVAEVNAAPQITVFEPINPVPTASFFSPLDFSATAIDPDLDSVTFEWHVDGVPVSSSSGFTLTPNIGETGTRIVKLIVSDDNPLSVDAIEIRVVLLLDERQTPDVIGLSQAAAEAAIIAGNLMVGAVTTANSNVVPAGDVISQDPVGGTIVLAGAAVHLVVSLGPALATVPDVVSLSQAAAEAAIIAVNLTVGTVSTANSNVVPAGNVISQDPIGGVTLPPGEPVNLVVSLGPEQNNRPVVDAGPDATINEGETFMSIGTFVDPDSDSWTATVDYGDGSGSQPLALNPDKTFNLSHTYANAGSFVVTVTITDNDNGVGQDIVEVIVRAIPPEPPADLQARAKITKVQLVWTHNGADSYNVYRSQIQGGPFNLIANTSSTYSTYLDEGLTIGTTYFYIVTSVKGANESIASGEVNVTPRARIR